MNSIRLLLIDDDSKTRADASVLLARGNAFDVHEATSLAEGLELASRSRPQLILLERQIAAMDGCTTLDRLRASGIDAPVIILTTNADPREVAGCHAIGAIGAIQKPYRPDTFSEQVRELFETVST